MNREQRRARSRRPPPPQEGLICRAEAGVILRKSRSTVFRYEEDGLLVAVCTDGTGTRWFELKAVMQLAARLALEERAGHVSSSRQKVVIAASPPPVEEEDYHPERRVRRPLRTERPTSVAPLPPVAAPPAPPRPAAPKGEEKPLLPSAKGAIAIRTKTVVDPNWFNDALDPTKGKDGSE
jgi:hypothetical protein